MVKVIESGCLRATVDMNDLNFPKISVETIQPIDVQEYHSNFDVWHWESDIARDAKRLYTLVDGLLFNERCKARRAKLCGAS